MESNAHEWLKAWAKARLDGNTRHAPVTVELVHDDDVPGRRSVSITTCHGIGLVVMEFRLEQV